MDIINNIVWYFGPVNRVIDKDTDKNITEEKLKTIVFDDSVNENVKICFPLNDDYDFTEIRELQRPVTVQKLLQFIKDFYDEPLKEENLDKIFKNKEDKEYFLYVWNDCSDGDISGLRQFDVFDDTCTPDFCGIRLVDDDDENNGSYFVDIGPI